MEPILQQVKRARLRLSLQLLVDRLLRCWFASAIVAVVAIALPKLIVIESLPEEWTTQCAIAALLAGAFFAPDLLAGVFLFVTLCPGSYGARIVTGSVCARETRGKHGGMRVRQAYASPRSIILSKKRRS